MNWYKNNLLHKMQVIEYTSLSSLVEKAGELNQKVLETDTSFSFRIFENRQTKELHIYQKPIK